MKTYISEFEFRDALYNYYSYEAITALWDYYEDLESDTNEKIVFDVVCIYSDWNEYKSFKDFQKDYSNLKEIKTIDDLRDRTEVIEFEGGLLVGSF